VAGPVAAVVANPAAAAPLEVVAAEWEAAVVVNPAVAAARAVVAVDVRPVVAEAAKAVVAVDVRPVVEAEAAKVVVGKAAVVVDARPAVVVDKVVDKVVEEEADARLVVVAADPPVVAVEWEVEQAVVDVLQAVAEAAETVNSLSSSGASRMCGAPFFY
jgi:hypothetical protein